MTALSEQVERLREVFRVERRVCLGCGIGAVCADPDWGECNDGKFYRATATLPARIAALEAIAEAAEIIGEYGAFEYGHGRLGAGLDAALARLREVE